LRWLTLYWIDNLVTLEPYARGLGQHFHAELDYDTIRDALNLQEWRGWDQDDFVEYVGGLMKDVPDELRRIMQRPKNWQQIIDSPTWREWKTAKGG
jgi:hypothetical protein